MPSSSSRALFHIGQSHLSSPTQAHQTIATMSQPTNLFTPSRCWSCTATNISTALQCGRCNGAVTPKLDRDGNEIQWSIFTFGPDASTSGRSSFSCLDDVMQVFTTEDRVAIRLSNEHKRYVLVQHSQQESIALYSVRSVDAQGHKETVTKNWSDITDEDQASLSRFVEENVAAEEGMPSKLYRSEFP